MAPRAHAVSLSMNQRRPKPHLPWLANVPNALDLSYYPFAPDARRLPALPRADEPRQGRAPRRRGRARGRPAAQDRRQVRGAGRTGVLRRASCGPTSATGVEYVGEVTHGEKVELLQHARATLFPIEWEEPFGLVMIESMACGTPVIATRWGAVPEVIEHGRTGIIVDEWRAHERRARGRRRLDPDVHAPRGRGALHARADGRRLRRRVRVRARELMRAAAVAVRPRDPPARGAGARVARRRAALHPRRHGDRRPPRPRAARRARDRGGRAQHAVRDLQLPPVRDDRAGRAGIGRGRGASRATARRPGALAVVSASASRSPRCSSALAPAVVGADGRRGRHRGATRSRTCGSSRSACRSRSSRSAPRATCAGWPTCARRS